jgi:hypothetical protein
MMRPFWRLAGLAALAWTLSAPTQASAKGLILITWGDSISHVGDVTARDVPNLPSKKMGYKYSYFGVFWIDLWTWGGQHCLYEDKQYWPLEPADAAHLIGKQTSDLSSPFLYRFPLGWLILGPLILLGIIGAALDKGQGGKPAGSLLEDPRYQQALKIMTEHYNQPSPDAATHPHAQADKPAGPKDEAAFRAAFEAGVAHLVEQGVPREEAERNLTVLVDALAQAPPQPAGPAA